MCRLSRNLYNKGLFESRQYFFDKGKVLPYNDLYKLCKDNENYSLLPAQTSQQVLKSVTEAMKSFMALSALKQAGQYDKPVHLPQYLKEDEYAGIAFPAQNISVKENGKFKIPMSRAFKKKLPNGHTSIWVSFPPNLDPGELKEIYIYPVGKGRAIKIAYTYQLTAQPTKPTEHHVLGIDLGVDNFASCISTTGTAFLMDGRYMKSLNQYFNKRMALQNQKDALYGIQGMTDRKFLMIEKRNNRIADVIFKTAKYIVLFCLENDIDTIVVGHNPSQKQSTNMGKVNNQNFAYLPFGKFRSQLAFLCAKYGLTYMETEESYTSLSSFLDKDPLPVYGAGKDVTFSGERVHRGLYVTKDKVLVNADLNAAANIIRKCFPQIMTGAGYDGLTRALKSSPQRIRFSVFREMKAPDKKACPKVV